MIRAQYHFRATGHGLLAWDVRRLIALSDGLPVKSVDLGQIAELNENHWYQHGHVVPTCNSVVEHCALIQGADLAYPIILDSAGRVMDGMHRVCKARLQGLTRIHAVQFADDPAPDYIDCDPDTLPYDD
ncbi:hypothetical protein EGI20_03070 [Aquitalea sp. S1-19]|nr:hypothetical protein [Aquitalea sp. S1-19]